jgi:hypothetical protein
MAALWVSGVMVRNLHLYPAAQARNDASFDNPEFQQKCPVI